MSSAGGSLARLSPRLVEARLGLPQRPLRRDQLILELVGGPSSRRPATPGSAGRSAIAFRFSAFGKRRARELGLDDQLEQGAS